MSTAPAPRTGAPAREHGFALLVLLAILGAGSLGVLVAVQAIRLPSADAPQRSEANVAATAAAVRAAFRGEGTFPASLDALAATAGLDPAGAWRRDPWAAADLDYRSVAGGRRVRSRGPDARLGTADDEAATVATEPLVRMRQRGRLRLIRSLLLRSRFRDDAAMPASDRAAMQVAMRDHAIALRRWRGADAAARVALQATLDSTSATVAALVAAHGLPSLPSRVTGATGLMAQLGLPDELAVDGMGRALLRDPVLGVRAAGSDRRRDTDDDM